MTRAEIRRIKREEKVSQVKYTLTYAQIEKIKHDAMNEASDIILAAFFGIPLLILQNEYGWGTKKRLPEFAEHITNYYQDFVEGKYTKEELEQLVIDYTGISFRRDVK